MNNSLLYQALLLGAAALCAACSGSEEAIQTESPPVVREWSVSVEVIGDSIHGMEGVSDAFTRALFYGGNTGHRFSFIWDTGDIVAVYKGETSLGTLTPSVLGQESTTLTGTLTGDIAVDDVLTLYLPTRAYDYSTQDGTLSDLSLNHSYQQSNTTVTEAKASGSSLSLAATGMTHAQAYWWLRLTDENGDRIHPTRLQIYGTSGKMVKTKAVDGTTTYFTEADPLDVTISKSDDNGEYPGESFIAVRNEKGSADTYKFKAWVGEDVYVGPYDRALTYAVTNGKMDNVKRQLKKTTVVSTLTVEAIPAQTFTGSPYEPVLVVKDGETTLTLGTDYTVTYSDNTNGGTATATVTGLADAGAVAATKYLGTTTKTFQITQATPVITMDASDITLEVGTSQTRTVTAVTIDNSAFSLADLDIMSAPYNCTITYTSGNPDIATVDATTGEVTGVAPGTVTITATVASTASWTTQSASYTVKVSPRVNTSGNSTWTTTEEEETIPIYQ